jgi:hypothetical protein
MCGFIDMLCGLVTVIVALDHVRDMVTQKGGGRARRTSTCYLASRRERR